MKNYRIIVMGCVEFSNFFLKELIKKKINLVGICTKKKSKFNSDFSDLSIVARKKKIPYIYWNNKKQRSVFSWIKDKKPDFIFCVGWPNIIKERYLKVARFFYIGFHPSNLPYNRGRHPIIWSIILGLKSIASTFFIMSKYADNGFILSKKKINLSNKENSQKLYKKILKTTKKQIPDLLNKIDLYKLKKNSIKQLKNNIKFGNFLRLRTFNDGVVDWRMSAENIDRLVRALGKPYVGATFYLKKKPIKLWNVSVHRSKNNLEPGKVLKFINNKPLIQTGKNLIKILKTDPKIKIKKSDYLI